MKYLIQIWQNPQSRAMWEQLPEDSQMSGLAVYQALNAELADSGEMIAAEALADPSLATRVTAGESGVVTSDGPFAEVKELLAGFYFVDVESKERAVEIAARIPEAAFGLVEVRPVLDHTLMD